MALWTWFKDNTILVCRLAIWLICTFLRLVWGGGKVEGYSPSVRTSTQPDTTVGTVRFRTHYLKHFSRSNFLLYPFLIIKAFFCGYHWVRCVQFLLSQPFLLQDVPERMQQISTDIWIYIWRRQEKIERLFPLLCVYACYVNIERTLTNKQL